MFFVVFLAAECEFVIRVCDYLLEAVVVMVVAVWNRDHYGSVQIENLRQEQGYSTQAYLVIATVM